MTTATPPCIILNRPLESLDQRGRYVLELKLSDEIKNFVRFENHTPSQLARIVKDPQWVGYTGIISEYQRGER